MLPPTCFHAIIRSTRYPEVLLFFIFLIALHNNVTAQQDSAWLTLDRIFDSNEFQQEFATPYQWSHDGHAYYQLRQSKLPAGGQEIVRHQADGNAHEVFVSAEELTPQGHDKSLSVASFSLSKDESKVLIFTDTKRVWRSNTKGNYWVFDRVSGQLRQIGASLPPSSLMFAKFSPDNRFVAYVSNFNLYKEDFASGQITQLTTDGNNDIINGTFDWVYEEEFGCRDGFRWSPDGRHIAYWQLDASQIGTFFMINNTDSIYPKIIPVQYPKVGHDPSACKVGILNPLNGKTKWIAIPGDPKQNFIPRMQWIRDDLLLIQQINRKQNHLIYWNFNPNSGNLRKVYEEKEDTWVDIDYPDMSSTAWGMYDMPIIDEVSVTRMTEGDGWRHAYKINLVTGDQTLLTPGQFDVASLYGSDREFLYFSASPYNGTQRYLYRVPLDGTGDTVRITPSVFQGFNYYNLSPNAQYAVHGHQNVDKPLSVSLIAIDNHQILKRFTTNKSFAAKVNRLKNPQIDFFKVTTVDAVEIDGRIVYPVNFDPKKKYPVLFHVYGEPWGQVARDSYVGLWSRYLAQKGYVIIDMDNRGTPCLKGSKWRKSIYRKIGVINSRDQAMAAKEVLKWPFVDTSRIGVWGWSGGGSMTLNLLFRYPEIYGTGMSVAPVSNQLYYDNIYQERYMGLPSENLEDFVAGSPLTFAHNLQGNLLLVHGTADDNVHYQNAEALINELIKHNKQFDMMSYPNRSHGIWEGENTTRHVYTLLTRYLTEHVPPGPVDPSAKP